MILLLMQKASTEGRGAKAAGHEIKHIKPAKPNYDHKFSPAASGGGRTAKAARDETKHTKLNIRTDGKAGRKAGGWLGQLKDRRMKRPKEEWMEGRMQKAYREDQVAGESRWQYDGCPTDNRPDVGRQKLPRCALLSSRAGIRCCNETSGCASVCWGNCWMTGSRQLQPRTAARFTLGAEPRHGGAATYFEASEECAAWGMRLCTKVELSQSSKCCRTGCRLDNALVWTADRCTESTSSAMYAAEHVPSYVLYNLRMAKQYREQFNNRILPHRKACSRWCGLAPRFQALAESHGVLQCGVIWFMHIGKTGGSTVTSLLRKLSMQTHWSFVDFWDWQRNPKWQWNASQEWHEICKLISERQPHLLVHHHHFVPGVLDPSLMAWLEALRGHLQAQDCQLVVSTVLREPVSRALSEFEYNMQIIPVLAEYIYTHSDTQLKTFSLKMLRDGKGHGSGLYTRDPALQGSHALMQPGGMLSLALNGTNRNGVRQQPISELFDVVGVTNRLGEFLSILCVALGVPTCSAEPENKTPDCNKLPPLNTELLWWAEKHNQADVKLYESFCASSSCGGDADPTLRLWRELPAKTQVS